MTVLIIAPGQQADTVTVLDNLGHISLLYIIFCKKSPTCLFSKTINKT